MGVLICRSLVTPKFSVPPSGETMRQNRNVLEVQERAEVLYHHAKFGVAWISPAARAAKNVEFLSVRHAFERQTQTCSLSFAMKSLEYRNDFNAVGQGKVCSCARVFNFLRLPTSLNAEVQKTAITVFLAAGGRHNKPIETNFDT